MTEEFKKKTETLNGYFEDCPDEIIEAYHTDPLVQKIAKSCAYRLCTKDEFHWTLILALTESGKLYRGNLAEEMNKRMTVDLADAAL